MGSDLGNGFIVLLLSCDLHMMQPLLIGQIVLPQGHLHFEAICMFKKQKVAIFKIKVTK